MDKGLYAVRELKYRIRQRVWRLLEERNACRPPYPIVGRIPNFIGAEAAAQRLSLLPEWRRARVIKINPDSPQRPVRMLALMERKLVLMPTPRIKSGFLLLNPNLIPRNEISYAASIRGAFRFGKIISTIEDLMRIGDIDLIVEGSVAVDLNGNRLGKGEGYGELEYAILKEIGLVGSEVPIATTVHELQIVNNIPSEPWDVPVDIIVTPMRTLRVYNRGPRPQGIIWNMMPVEKLEEIPLLKELYRKKHRV